MTFAVAFFVVFIIGVWKTLEKAGQPGWADLFQFTTFTFLHKLPKNRAGGLSCFSFQLPTLYSAFFYTMKLRRDSVRVSVLQ